MGCSRKENTWRAIRRDNPEWVPNGLEATVTIGSPIVERPDTAGLDAFGVAWSLDEAGHNGTYPAHGGHTISDLAGWREQFVLPDVKGADWSRVAARAKDIDRDECLIMGFLEMGLFERSYLLLGMGEALMAYLTEPDAMRELLGAVADFKIQVIEMLDDAIDMDILWLGDDWGTQENLFMPPECWRYAIKPHTQRIYDCLKSRDIVINQHSCGKIESVFGDMVEMGADIWNPCQPCNDLAMLKRAYGNRITFCGGIDSQFVLDRPGVTPEDVRAEVRTRIDQLAQGGGYIAGPSHCVPFALDLLNAMNDEIATYGRAVYATSHAPAEGSGR